MPIYEYQCADGHITEEIFRNYKAPSTMICQHCYNEDTFCGLPAKQIVSMPAMQPDKHWSGTMVAGEYVTSAKQYKEVTKNMVPATRENVEYVEKRKGEFGRQEEKKREKRRDQFFDSFAHQIDI